MYGIFDWANNRLHPDKEFQTFEDGWEFIFENYPEDEHQELSVWELGIGELS